MEGFTLLHSMHTILWSKMRARLLNERRNSLPEVSVTFVLLSRMRVEQGPYRPFSCP